jgi:hypothetical protein
MIVSAHQPNFLPWLGYLHKVLESDVFVAVDHVQFERQNFQNRTRIRTAAGPLWLVVPVRQHSQKERICDKEIDNKRDGRTTWGERIFRTLHHAYARAPHYASHRDFLEATLTRRWTHLVDLNLALLRYLLEQLEISTPILRSSRLEGVGGARTEMVRSVCAAAGASVYLSGNGGSRQYLDVEMLRRSGVEVRWQRFEHPRYPQGAPSAAFLPNLSALDLLLWCGPASGAILRGAAERREVAA